MIQDLRQALRAFWKSPGFTAVAVLTLALGIGANTAIFSIVNAVLLRPLPFRDPSRLVELSEYDTRRGDVSSVGSISYPDFADIRSLNHSFESVAAFDSEDFTLTGAGEASHVKVATVSTSLFGLLGVRPSLGREFAEGEDAAGHHVAVLSDGFWRRRFNADPAIIGHSLNLNGRTYTITGIMPAGFQFPVEAEPEDLWVTFSHHAEVDDPGDTPVTTQRGDHFLNVIARLKSTVAMEQANADLASIAHVLAQQYPKTNLYNGMDARTEIDFLVGETRKPLLVLFGAVGLVLLIACANVANLLLARATGRVREIAIRSALGASRGRVIQQLMAEALTLSVAGALLGTVVAIWSLDAILSLYPSNLPRAASVGIDYRVLLFSAGLAIVTGVLFGLVPALQVSRPNLTEAIGEGSRSSTPGRTHKRLRAGLVIAETALGMTLLMGAGLLMRSFNRLSHVNLGFNADHVLTANFDLSETRYNPDQQDQFVRELISRLKVLPGVTGVAGSVPLPISDNNFSISFNLLDHPVPEGDQPSAGAFVVVPGFFETMQIPLMRGRTFNDHDERNAPPVMIINQAFADKYFPNQNPIGHMIHIGAGEGAARARYKTRTVVGVVGNFRKNDLSRAPQPIYFVPLSQLMWGAPTLIIRTAGQPAAIAPEIRQALSSMDSDAPLYNIRTLDDYLALDLGRARFQTLLLTIFAAIALLLTAVGLYGVMAYTVVQRTQEIGIRVALGASPENVLRMMLQTSFSMTGVGLLLGVGGALAMSRVLSDLLYDVKTLDLSTLVMVALVLAVVSLIASYIPAWRAAKVEPTVALRCE
jgi:putative ABC transport system permease protein